MTDDPADSRKRFTAGQLLAFGLGNAAIVAAVLVVFIPRGSDSPAPSTTPSTVERTTSAPTTVVHTTVVPTTAAPTTSPPTTSSPTVTASQDYPEPPFIVKANWTDEKWIAVITEFPSGQIGSSKAAFERMAPLVALGFDPASVATADMPGLRPGSDIAFLGPFGSEAGAEAQCAGVVGLVDRCYVEQATDPSSFEGEDWWLGPLGPLGVYQTPTIPEIQESRFTDQ